MKSSEPMWGTGSPSAGMAGVRRAGAPPALPDLSPHPLQHRLVGGVLPQHQVLDDCKEPIALQLRNHFLKLRLGVLDHLVIGHSPPRRMCRKALVQLPLRGAFGLWIRQQHVDILGRVIDHLRKNDGPRCCQWAARPPQMQGAGVAVADRLLARGCPVDGVEGQRHLDQLLARCGHVGPIVIPWGRPSTKPSALPIRSASWPSLIALRSFLCIPVPWALCSCP